MQHPHAVCVCACVCDACACMIHNPWGTSPAGAPFLCVCVSVGAGAPHACTHACMHARVWCTCMHDPQPMGHCTRGSMRVRACMAHPDSDTGIPGSCATIKTPHAHVHTSLRACVYTCGCACGGACPHAHTRTMHTRAMRHPPASYHAYMRV